MTKQDDDSGATAAPNEAVTGIDAAMANDCDCENFWFRSSDDVRDGYVRGIDAFAIKPVKYSVIDDIAIFEGDIALGTAENMDVLRHQVEGAGADSEEGLEGIVITGKRYLWPKGVVAWTSTPALRKLVLQAIEHWVSKTVIRFVERTPANAKQYVNWISFEALEGCYSSVGMQGGKQVISLGAGCGFGQAVHEIGHAVGLWHEQSREDRTNNVKIEWANITAGREHNFNQHIVDGDDVGGYDFASIMHYGPTAFSKNGKPTIVPSNGQSIGQRGGLSPGDIAAVRKLYA